MLEPETVFWWSISVVLCLFVLYFLLVPTSIFLKPNAVFFHSFEKIPFRDYNKLVRRKVRNRGRNFYLKHPDCDVKLGAWHVLPKSVSGLRSESKLTDEQCERLLSDEKFPVVLFLHGQAWDRLYDLLADCGFQVITIDYRGYGDSTGWPTEKGIVSDSKLIFKYIVERAASNTIYIWGQSMGTAVGTKLAMDICDEERREQGVSSPKGMILESPFNNLRDAVFNHGISRGYRWMPCYDRIFVQSLKNGGLRMNTEKWILRVSCPILILHAGDDHIVPWHLGQKLAKAAEKAQRDVTFVLFPTQRKYGHNGIFRDPQLPQILRHFVENCSGSAELKTGTPV